MKPTRLVTTAKLPSPWITHIAFLLALVVVVARVTTVDSLRDPWDATPGGGPIAHGPGPAVGLVYDLLMIAPALLVLLRRTIDSEFRLTLRWSHLPLLSLAGWAVTSVAWAADQFAAAVTAAHFFAAACLLWATSQLVRSCARFRLVAAIAFGLLVMLTAQSIMYRYVDLPENLTYWQEQKASILTQHGWDADSFQAKQFERKILSGETGGFFTSPNTLAAVGVLLFFACVGIGIQKLVDRDLTEWVALPILAAALLVWILVAAASKTAAATPVVGVAMVLGHAVFKKSLRRFSGLAYAAGVGLVTIGLLGVVAIGVVRGGLLAGHFSNSLDFRWKYWVASAAVFVTHPFKGVAWNNFSVYYLAHRLPEASEEIKDPHNFLVKILVELGVVGGCLLLAWLLRLGRELTTPRTAERSTAVAEDQPLTVWFPIVVVVLGMLISTLVSTDFSQPALDVLTLLLRPMVLFLALLLGTIAAAMLSPHTWTLDARPADWILHCSVAGLALFLLHNLIDFSWFEPGASTLFALLVGATLGMAPAEIAPAKPAGRAIATAVAVTGTVGWGAAAVLFVGPIVIGSELASAADDSISSAPADQSYDQSVHFRRAAELLGTAAAWVPYNPEYLFRQAKAFLGLGDVTAAERCLAGAIRLNPMYIDAYLLEANVRANALAVPDVRGATADFETAIRLNPNDVGFHIKFAEALVRFGRHGDAATQFGKALGTNAALPPGEPRRLTETQIAGLQQQRDHEKALK